jgi:hypothetical protein
MRSYLVEGKDAETTEASGKGEDLGVGWNGAGRGAENEERVLELSIDLVPAVRHVVRPKAALEMA